jgi:hypothetical protein
MAIVSKMFLFIVILFNMLLSMGYPGIPEVPGNPDIPVFPVFPG